MLEVFYVENLLTLISCNFIIIEVGKAEQYLIYRLTMTVHWHLLPEFILEVQYFEFH